MIVMHNNRNAALKRNSPPPHSAPTANGTGHATVILPRWRIATLVASALFFGLLPAVLHAQSDSGAPSEDATTQAGNAVDTQPMKDGIDLRADDVQAAIRIANPAKLRPGSKVDVTAHFNVASGWHIYGAPLPAGEDMTSTTMSFDQSVAAHQSLKMPPPTPLRFDVLGETLPVYQGEFAASAQLQLASDIKPGPQVVPGTLSFQECNNMMCKPPRQIPFSLPINVTD
jgi:Disulphide bond corrector protein DsbC